MKKAVVIALIAAAALIVIGGLVFVGVLAVNHWNIGLMSTTKFVTNTVDVPTGFRDITINSDTEAIDFLPSEDGKCKVIFHEPESEKHSAAVKDGVLTIEQNESAKWFDKVGLFSFDSPSITVFMPAGEYAALSIKESTGDIKIPKDFSFDSADIEVTTGDVEFKAGVKGKLRIAADTGKIRTEWIASSELELSVSTGRVEVSNVDCSGDINISVSTGKSLLTNVTCKNFTSTGSTGDVTLDNVIIAEKLFVNRSTGDVKLVKCDASEIEIETDTGSVTGTLLSEKVFIVRSDTGRVEVPETVTGGKCKITTDTGNIKIEIVNN